MEIENLQMISLTYALTPPDFARDPQVLIQEHN